jgi:TolB-like protein/DNA-binding winged helix-turn-helix (wHTH) protein
MDLQNPAAGIFQFGVFELDAKSGDLRRHGLKVRLPHQSFQILLLLLSRPGDVVTRDELRQALWEADTFVDFDVGLNGAVRKLREALDDSAGSPRFVETLPRRGYRFIAPVTALERVQAAAVSAPPIETSAPIPLLSAPPIARSRHPRWIAAALLVAVVVAVGTLYGGRASRIDSLAILPFDNLTGNATEGYFVDAVTDALTTHLAQVPGLDVTARTSARQSKQQNKSIPAIAMELNVDAVLEGSVVRAGDRVRISAQLVQAATNHHVWARTYDEGISHILELQQRIASEVAVAIGRASPAQWTGTDGRRPVAPAAYDAYLKGLTAAGLQRFDGYRTAVGYFEQAIARQPDFAEAHAKLAQAQLQFLFGGPVSPREAMPKAEAAARRAIELDATLPQAHRTLGQILSLFHWRWKEAEEEFHRAAQLRPDGADGSPPVVSMVRTGRFVDAIAEAERSRRRDPLSFAAQVNVATAYRAAGQYDRAIAELRRALEITPGHNRALFQLGVTYVMMGRFDDAVRELEAAVHASTGRNPRMDAYRGYAYARAGRPLDARRVLTDLEARRHEQYVSSFGIALIYDVLGEKAEALRAIERACDDHAVEFAQMREYPAFTTIASEPRFQAVMRRVNLPR